MAFGHVYLVTSRLNTVTPEQVASAEETLGFKFPDGYSDFVTRLGEGSYSNFVRVYLPSRIVEEHREFQDRWKQYFFWDKGHEVLTKEQIVESFIIADTVQGDELIFHPAQPNRLFVLPRYHDTVFVAGNGFPAAVDWLCKSGQLTDPITFDCFESWQQRRSFKFVGPGQFETVAKALEGLGIHDHIQTDEEYPLLEIFVSDFQGKVVLTAYDSHATAWLTHDAEANTKALERAIACLEGLGLVCQPDTNE
ncbi:hypothetical protein DN062_01820 [Nitrincola tibetensis]|uniref:Knr4/Smi1-like domain-containing protein n=1 Tax=Nitrincola tibetensis TaxID=2219697 RepID=A0A364NRX5_9GAMM|nr:SMI1/KNR4 family protein [Nitrincola tibetensis]RAU19836.1 hypothetical protein DN062_01820 [Nitrincola tibetensis]